MPLTQMQHDVDPKKVILDAIGMKKLGELPGFRLHGNRILVGVYERPVKTKSGLLLTDKYRQEDEWQGKAALVLMRGHSAFNSDDRFDFGPDEAKLGDWISLWVSDGRKIKIHNQTCRIIRDQDINMVIPSPDAVY